MSIDTQAVKRIVFENLREIHTIEDVARRMNRSPETVRKEFWRQEKLSLGDFILKTKVEAAKRLLVETDLFCKEICFEVGFRKNHRPRK